jgi:cytidine deaminase
VNEDDLGLLQRAEAAAAAAYAPYSNFRVGATLRARDGRIFAGTNVENASYPLGLCAERAALAFAVGAGCGPGDFEVLAVTASPCGGCRQWLLEFRVARVVYRGRSGEPVSRTPEELLPDAFVLSG